jgi:molecular chaperone DnaK
MKASSPIVGIDLGTTNSSVAVVVDGVPRLIPVGGQELVPSVISMTTDGSILVGRTAKNQAMLYPERTVRSIKRKMGEEITISLGDGEYSPVELSGMILRNLKDEAERFLEQPVERAVITVPAYFSDRQRTATREAGEVAGLTVERILNEPTAAALCYARCDDSADARTVMVYDLGGGTFDVSIVRSQGDTTEVLASHGDTALGGDDFDMKLAAWLRMEFQRQHGFELDSDLRTMARLMRVAEAAKIELSRESYAAVMEEHFVTRDGVGYHLDVEIARHNYEEMIHELVERTRDSVQTALREAKLLARDLDEVILVGGSTRTPMIAEMLRAQLELPPRVDVDPDKAVAMGAALAAARAAGTLSGQILVDVTPFTFGTSYVGVLNGRPYDACFKGVIRRSTPLPARQTDVFYTMVDGQQRVDVEILQGESDDARDNLRIGRFTVEGLDRSARSGSPILFDFRLDLDGILEVEVTERRTGLKKGVVIKDAFRKLSDQEVVETRERIRSLLGSVDGAYEEQADETSGERSEDRGDEIEEPKVGVSAAAPGGLTGEERAIWAKARSIIEKAEGLRPTLAEVDRREIDEVVAQLQAALEAGDFDALEGASNELADILFYLA